MKVAVDVCIGPRGIAALEAAGHQVVARAEHGEDDREWFARALDGSADAIISPDSDLEILAYDHQVLFFRSRNGDRQLDVSARFDRWAAKQDARRRAG